MTLDIFLLVILRKPFLDPSLHRLHLVLTFKAFHRQGPEQAHIDIAHFEEVLVDFHLQFGDHALNCLQQFHHGAGVTEHRVG